MTDFRLRTFLAVWREKSFTRAADTLCITQPAVTQHIQYLEADLGQKLFVLQGRALSLTAAGEILLRFAEKTEAEAARTRERIGSAAAHRTYRIGATRTIGEYVLPDSLAGWFRDVPSVGVSLTVDNSDALFLGLRNGEFDFLFVEGPFDGTQFTTASLLRDSIVLACPPEHPLAGHTVSLSDVLGETLIVRESGSGSRRLVESFLEGENLTLGAFSRVLEIGNIVAIKRLVARGVGLAFLYERSISADLSTGALSRIDFRHGDLSHDFAFVCLKDSLYESEYRAFLDYCRGSVR
jgi:DNA-binding transcriptional LysR family regulator